MRKLIAVALASIATAAVLPAGSLAANPPGTGQPGQDCVEIEEAGGKVPGKSSSSPGSAFNEEGIDSAEGGIGGQHYNEENSQYDVACFQVSHS
jgi:hypothetical protein